MRLWRIAARKWALDTACDGARLYGGRWNPPGTPLMYAGTTIEICALEKFVHLAGVTAPPLVLVAIDVPDEPTLVHRPAIADLPAGWSDLPISSAAQAFGRDWVDAGKHLMMLLPSAIIPEARNAVLNPQHPAFQQIELSLVRDFTFDSRMFPTS